MRKAIVLVAAAAWVRKAIVLLAAAACVLAGMYLYPVGGRIWTAAQVSGVAMIRDGRRVELAEPAALSHTAREAVLAARLDRFRRLIPALRSGACVPLNLALRTGGEWVDVPLRCTSGLLFDYIARDAWR